MEGARILIVEDEGITARHVQNYLRGLGYTVAGVVSTGEAAIEMTAQEEPDLVLMDIDLPGRIDGVDAARQLRTRFDIPVVYVTSYSDDVTLQRAEITEPYGYIIKPFQAREVRVTIEMALRSHKLRQALQRSEARYRAIVEDQTDPICRFTPDGIITFVNGAFCRLREQTPQDLLGRNLMAEVEDTAHAGWSPWAHFLSALSADQPTVTREQPGRLPSGEARWYSWTVHGVFDAQGRLLELQAVARDITERVEAEEVERRALAELERRVEERTAQLSAANTRLEQEVLERKRAEDVLRASEERYRRMVEAAGEGIGVLDADGRFVFVNRRLAYQLGRAPESLTGQPFLDFVDEESREAVIAGMARRPGAMAAQIEAGMNRSDGTPVWVLISSNPLSDAEGHHAGWVLVITEITRRKQAEQALKESEQRYRSAAETIEDCVAMTDSEDRIAFVNGRLVELLGYEPEEMIGQPIASFLPEEDRARAMAEVRQHLRYAPGQARCRLKRKTGRPIWVCLSSKPTLDTQGRYLGLVATFSDITAPSTTAARRKATS